MVNSEKSTASKVMWRWSRRRGGESSEFLADAVTAGILVEWIYS